MDKETAEKLLQLNRGFYSSFAETFADSRPVSDPALARILPHIPEHARVLDLGCGNGRIAHLLDSRRPGSIYVGVDVVDELVAIARDNTEELRETVVSIHALDIGTPGWAAHISPRSFDAILLLAVLHHIPSRERRISLLREAGKLMDSDGVMIVSVWQFLDSARMRRKIRPWSDAGIPDEMVDEGDYLLDWKRGGEGLRYCHLLDEDEIRRLANEVGLSVRQTFRAGGREGNLSLFAVMK